MRWEGKLRSQGKELAKGREVELSVESVTCSEWDWPPGGQR